VIEFRSGIDHGDNRVALPVVKSHAAGAEIFCSPYIEENCGSFGAASRR
jgi:hypothetical protein